MENEMQDSSGPCRSQTCYYLLVTGTVMNPAELIGDDT